MNRLSQFRDLTQRWFGPAKPRSSGRRPDRFERRRLGRICGLESLESRELLTWAATAASGLLTISEVGTPGSQGDTGVLKVDPLTDNILLDQDNSGNFQQTGLSLSTLAGPIQINAGQLINSNFIIDNKDGHFFQPTGFFPTPGNPGANPPIPALPTFNYSGGTGINQNNSLTVLGQTGIADSFRIGSAGFNSGLLTLTQPINQITLQQNRMLVGYSNLGGNLNLNGVDGLNGLDTLTIDATKGDSWDVNGNTIQGPFFQYLPPPPNTPPPLVAAGDIVYSSMSKLTINAPFNGNTTPTVISIDSTATPIQVNGGDLDIFNLNQPLAFPVTLNGFNGTAPGSTVNVNGSAGNDNIYVDYQTIALDANPADRIQPGGAFTHAGANISYVGVATLNVAGMGGDNTFTLQAPPALQAPFLSNALPAKVVFFGSNGTITPAIPVGQNLLRILGNDPSTNSVGADVIKVSDFGGANPIQMVNMAGLVIYGLGGNNDLENLSAGNPALGVAAVPAVLIGGSGNDTLVGGAGGDVLLGGAGMNVLNGSAAAISTTTYFLPHQDQNGNIFDPYLQPTGAPGLNPDLSSITTGKGNDIVVTGARQPLTFGDPGDIDNFKSTNTAGAFLQQIATVDPQNPTASLYQVTPALQALEQAFGISNGQFGANPAALLEFGTNRNLRGQFATYAAFVGRAYNDFLVNRKVGLGTSGVVSTAEINYWVGQGQQGLTVQQMQASLLASDELRQTVRLSDAWVRGLFLEVAGRLPTPAETNAYLAPLVGNDTAALRYQLALQFLNSPVGTSGEISEMYANLVPKRSPTSADLQAIQADLASGVRMEQVAQILVSSNGDYANYAIAHGVGEIGFIGGLFQSVLGRPASSNDLTFFAGLHANGVSNQTIASLLVASPEHRAQVVQGYYQTYLHRNIDPAGLNFWLGVLASGAGEEQVLSAIVGSDEYYLAHGGTSDSFIRAIYHDILLRTTSPSQPEIDYWIATLAASTRGAAQARADVVLGFATSDEYRSQLINSWYQAYLGRAPSFAEVNNALNEFHLGASQDAVQVQILLSKPIT